MTAVAIHLTLNYNQKFIFKDFKLTLEAGKMVCLLGKSGSGKSSLLRFIAGLLPTTVAKGSVVTADHKPLVGRVAWMAQQDLLLPWFNAIDNATIGPLLRNQCSGKTRETAQQLLEQLELGNATELYPHELSGGMRQRVALARTLIEERSLNLLDEPFSGLDASTRFQLQALASRLLAKRTTLLVTHDPLEALRMADLIYVLRGSPAIAGDPIQLSGNPPRELSDPWMADIYNTLMQQLNLRQ